MDIIIDKSCEAATPMINLRWPNPASAVVLTSEPSQFAAAPIKALAGVSARPAAKSVAGVDSPVGATDVVGEAFAAGDVSTKHIPSTNKFMTRLGLKTWSPPPV